MLMRKLLVSAMIAAGSLGAVMVPLPGTAASNVSVQLNFGPPAPHYEPPPAPRSGYVWSPGHWAWDGYRHVWVAGHWEAVRAGYAYSPPAWLEQRGRRDYRPSQWDPIPGAAASSADIQLNFGPPPLRYEAVPAPRHGHIWSPGYWAWDGHRHSWVGGHWERTRSGYAYYAPRWVERSGRWYYQSSRWDRDSDRDGIADRRDRTPYGNRDSDRDGIPDHRDRTPYGSSPAFGPGPGFGSGPGYSLDFNRGIPGQAGDQYPPTPYPR